MRCSASSFCAAIGNYRGTLSLDERDEPGGLVERNDCVLEICALDGSAKRVNRAEYRVSALLQ